MSENEDLARVKIFKFDPEMDKEQRYETFEVPYEGRTILNVLEAIYRGFDQGLAFRCGCEGKHDSRCGACAIQVNGLPALACKRISEKEMVIEPHAKFEVIKDLVVDFNKIRKEIPKKEPSVQISIDPDKCMKCGDCVAICPVGVYETKKGEIRASGAEFCCGDTCNQCVTYCHTGAITLQRLY
jgi:succinate dehydrogenase/fumarate reductase-like Fe-S protein